MTIGSVPMDYAAARRAMVDSQLRPQAVTDPRVVAAMAPYVQDAVITGHDRSEIGVLVFLSEAGRGLPPEQAAAHVRQGLCALKAEHAGSSQTPVRALVLDGAPGMAIGEITDKGYVNQRLVLQGRATEVEALYATGGGPRIITA